MTTIMTTPGGAKTRRGKFFRLDMWTATSLGLLLLFGLFLLFPLFGVLKESVLDGEGGFTFANFAKFFANDYYFGTIRNSFVVSLAVTVVSLVIGVPFSYFYTFFKLRGAKFLFVGAVLSCMSAPFIGAYAWILLLGRNGVATRVLEAVLPFSIGSIYGFGGIVLVLDRKSTRLNSSHVSNSYAVFCLKKKS